MYLEKIISFPKKSFLCGFFIFSLIVLGLGCATPAMYNSWKGAHVSELIEEWGKPKKKVFLEKGGTLYIYNKVPGEAQVNYLDNYTPPTKLVGFYANKKGIIYKWKEKPLGKSLFKN